MPNLWERQEGETDKAFAAFVAYRDLGTSRSLEKAWQELNRNKTGTMPGFWRDWSSLHKWVERSAAYDAHIDSLRVSALGDGIKQDRIIYRDTVKKEAAAFAEAAVAMRREAMLMDNKADGSLMLARASQVWEKARSIEGIALGLIEGGK